MELSGKGTMEGGAPEGERRPSSSSSCWRESSPSEEEPLLVERSRGDPGAAGLVTVEEAVVSGEAPPEELGSSEALEAAFLEECPERCGWVAAARANS